MTDFTLILKKREPRSPQRERGDVIKAYVTGTENEPSLDKFDVVFVTNAPTPHLTFLADLSVQDRIIDVLRNSRLWAIDEDELPPPRRTELINTGTTTIAWGQFRQALKLKQDLIFEADDLTTRRGKGRAVTDADVTTP